MGVVRLAFDRLRDRDSRLPSRRRIRHQLLLASEESIETAEQQLHRQRFDVEVRRNENGTATIFASHEIAPSSAAIEQITEFFEDLAREHGGEYDGWVAVDEGRA